MRHEGVKEWRRGNKVSETPPMAARDVGHRGGEVASGQGHGHGQDADTNAFSADAATLCVSRWDAPPSGCLPLIEMFAGTTTALGERPGHQSSWNVGSFPLAFFQAGCSLQQKLLQPDPETDQPPNCPPTHPSGHPSVAGRVMYGRSVCGHAVDTRINMT